MFCGAGGSGSVLRGFFFLPGSGALGSNVRTSGSLKSCSVLNAGASGSGLSNLVGVLFGSGSGVCSAGCSVFSTGSAGVGSGFIGLCLRCFFTGFASGSKSRTCGSLKLLAFLIRSNVVLAAA